MVEIKPMLARLLPQGDYSLMTRELLHHQVGDRLAGTLATVLHAVQHGVALGRVHDVAAMVQTVRRCEARNSRAETRLPTYAKD